MLELSTAMAVDRSIATRRRTEARLSTAQARPRCAKIERVITTKPELPPYTVELVDDAGTSLRLLAP